MKLKTFIVSVCVLFFVGCGYKPSAYHAKQVIGDKVYVDLKVDIEDPRNSVLVKDVMNELILQKLDKQLVYKKEEADTLMVLKYRNITISSLSYDAQGYTKLYKVSVDINVKYAKNGAPYNSFNVTSSYNFSVLNGGVISESRKFDAIKTASDKAMNEVLSKLAIADFK